MGERSGEEIKKNRKTVLREERKKEKISESKKDRKRKIIERSGGEDRTEERR